MEEKTNSTMRDIRLTELKEAQRLSKQINKSHKEAVENLKRFLLDNVGLGKVFNFPEDVEYTIDTTEEGGNFAYVSNIRIVKPWEGVEDYYEIQFTWETGNPGNENDWRRLDDYDWDLETFIEAIIESLDY